MPKPKIHTVVMAGGSGTRFWPAGRASKPKQLLALDGDDPRPLLELTLDRVAPLSSLAPRLLIARNLKGPIASALPDLPLDQTIWEPTPRNTAAAVALAAYTARAENPDAPVLVVPADHHVAPLGAYRKALRAMAARARASDSIVTLGLEPTRPAIGYGYLRLGAPVEGRHTAEIRTVARYVEKPNATQAKRYVRGRQYLWNGGTFAFRPAVFIDELAQALPGVAEPMDAAFAKYGTRGFGAALRLAYEQMPSVSVDYGVMERARQVEVVVATLDWDDLGSWDSVARHRALDPNGNALRGDVTTVDSGDCVVEAAVGHVALLGVRDLIVVRTGDTVLVARRGMGQEVREIVAQLRDEKREDLLR